ncbi:MAG: HAMP domain-containing protein, partial [Comamonas sp.]|nr:HAMP domain-containing protein [Comamonas sp.]
DRLVQVERWRGLSSLWLIHAETASVGKSDNRVREARQKETLYMDEIKALSNNFLAGTLDYEPDVKTVLMRVRSLRGQSEELGNKINSLRDDGQDQQSLYVWQKELEPTAQAWNNEVENLYQEQLKMREKTIVQSRQKFNNAVLIAALIAAVGVGFGLLLGAQIVRQITQPLAQAVALAKTIAQGDLTPDIQTSRGDELGVLLSSLGAMVLRLRGIVGEVRQGVDAVSSAAGQIASGNQDLSMRTETTATSLQQTAASVEQITAIVNQSADSVRQVNQLASTAAQAATQGGEVVEQVVASMEEINASSRKISDIIGVIDGIAFQTNILALNAAVEAARAGEQGRGFAVVAGEVRALAGRSADAAKEIKHLIDASVRSVDIGTQQVHEAGQSMEDIVTGVRRVTDLIGEITAAAAEQSQGIAEVNQSVGNLDQMTQQNAALVEQSSAAASAMHEQAQRLAQAIAVFKLSAGASQRGMGTALVLE